MVFLWLSHDQAETLAACCIDPTLRQQIQRAIWADFLPGEEHPRTVILEDHGDGLAMSAVTYFSAEAADRAAERWWADVVADRERALAASLRPPP